jgi:hypothetical protein
MNHSNLLSPAALNTTAFTIIALSSLMVAIHTSLLALAARRTPGIRNGQFIAPLLAAVLLSAWLSWAVLAVSERVVAPEPPPFAHQLVQQPALLIEMAVFVLAGVGVLFASKTMRALNAAMPPEWLIGVQTYRVAGMMFLWPYLASGALPAGFALPAFIGDTLTGLAAPFVAWAVAHNRPGAKARAVAWNCFGVLDLLVAPAAAVLTHSTNIGRYPLVIVPLFLGPPIGILTHIYSLRNLSQTRPGAARASAKAYPQMTGDRPQGILEQIPST